MMDERREAQASLYVLGALPPEEVREFEAALRADRQLQLLVQDLRGTTGAMAAAFPRVGPPPALKQKILAAIDRRDNAPANVLPLDPSRGPPWMFWMPWALAACFAILCVVLISIGHSLRQQAVHLFERLGEKNEETADLREQLAQTGMRASQEVTNYQTRITEIQRQILQRVEEINRQNAVLTNQLQQQNAESRRQLASYRDQANTLTREKKVLEEALAGVTTDNQDRLNSARLVVLRPTANGPPGVVGASVWSGPDQRGLLVVENLPPLPATQTYQFWLIDPRLGIPVSGGLLPPSATGSVRTQFTPQIRVDAAERFAISIEPSGGSALPTPGRIIAASN